MGTNHGILTLKRNELSAMKRHGRISKAYYQVKEAHCISYTLYDSNYVTNCKGKSMETVERSAVARG